MAVKRFIRHLLALRSATRSHFPKSTLDAIEDAIRTVEASHHGEIRFVVETALDGNDLWRQCTPRERAIEVFSQQRVWNTELNNGILLYVLMADHAVEIVCDRGIAAREEAAIWQRICHDIEAAFSRGEFRVGAIEGIKALGKVLEQHYPGVSYANDLPNRPSIN
ncbi:TPM domain-containing protein [Carnimonas bestiolae]|uniref:TPM domain-containing protein n=1 Tax=Carnimonas bestiolae TaxID=3402172 RepID=UPI003EDC88D3